MFQRSFNISGQAQHSSLKIVSHRVQHVQINSSYWHLVITKNFVNKILCRKKVVKWSSFLSPSLAPYINLNHLGLNVIHYYKCYLVDHHGKSYTISNLPEVAIWRPNTFRIRPHLAEKSTILLFH